LGAVFSGFAWLAAGGWVWVWLGWIKLSQTAKMAGFGPPARFCQGENGFLGATKAF